MRKELSLQLSAKDAGSPIAILSAIKSCLNLRKEHSVKYKIMRKSLDARGKVIHANLKLLVYVDEQIPANEKVIEATNVNHAEEVHIIGAGPAGLFCALRCIELGFKPIIIERGKEVRERRRDIALLNREGILNTESNYCFGEGGAGTYSDGKLYTRSTKRGNVQKVLNLFHYFGAPDAILYEAHPHIGTNKLPSIIQQIREFICSCGGEVHFKKKLCDFSRDTTSVKNIVLSNGESTPVKHLVLATGHSASDIYKLLNKHNIAIESKPFALGIRIEHPQQLIDSLQYKCTVREPYLPASSYSLVEQIEGRGVFSFCMCPGGIIAPASTHEGQLVVNGWSPSKRDNPYANSGMVVTVNQADFGSNSPLAGLAYQAAVERAAFNAGGRNYQAPAQRMTDFVNDRYSSTLPACSYLRGVTSYALSEVLPKEIYKSLAAAMVQFGKKMKTKFASYYTQEAIVVATESRTSSPVRIPRNPDTLAHTQIHNLYPCAEGAGYAGGIVSACLDGMRVAESICNRVG